MVFFLEIVLYVCVCVDGNVFGKMCTGNLLTTHSCHVIKRLTFNKRYATFYWLWMNII